MFRSRRLGKLFCMKYFVVIEWSSPVPLKNDKRATP